MIKPSYNIPDEASSGSSLPERQPDSSLPAEHIKEVREKAFTLVNAEETREQFRLELWKRNPSLSIKYEIYAENKKEVLVASRARDELFLRQSLEYIRANFNRLAFEVLGFEYEGSGEIDYEYIASRWTGYSKLYLGLGVSPVFEKRLSFDPLKRLGINTYDDFVKFAIPRMYERDSAFVDKDLNDYSDEELLDIDEKSHYESHLVEKLLQDPDPKIVALVRKKIAEEGNTDLFFNKYVCPHWESLMSNEINADMTLYCREQYARLENEFRAGRFELESHHILYSPEAENLFFPVLKHMKRSTDAPPSTRKYMLPEIINVAGASVPRSFEEFETNMRITPKVRRLLGSLDPIDVFVFSKIGDMPFNVLCRALSQKARDFLDLTPLSKGDLRNLLEVVSVLNKDVRIFQDYDLDAREVEKRFKQGIERLEELAKDLSPENASEVRNRTCPERFARYLLNLSRRRNSELNLEKEA